MTSILLPVFALLAVALLALATIGAVAFVQARAALAPLVHSGCAIIAGLGAIAALAVLVDPGPAAAFTLPIGLPGVGMQLALDPLAAFFLLLLCISAAACAAYALSLRGAEALRTLTGFPVLLAGLWLALLAGDGWTLVFGMLLASIAAWALMLASAEDAAGQGAATLYLGVAMFGAACLVPMCVLLAPGDGALRFAAMRAAPPEGWRAVVVLALLLLGAGAQAGLAPLHVWLPRAHAAAPAHAAALLSGAMTKVALYVVIRIVFDIAGPVQSMGWAVPLLAMGAASAVLGALRANLEADIKSALAAGTIAHVGFIAIGLGIALLARAADLAPLAAIALGASLLHALNHGVFKTLLLLCAGAAQQAAGTRAFARLGGLIHRMPVTTACALVGAASLAAVPPFSGFASLWLLLQAVFAAPRIGGLALQASVTTVAAVMALAIALAAAAAVRLIGVAFLGRPRSPRASAAEEAPPAARRAMLGLAAISLLLGVLPGPVLALTDPVLRRFVGAGSEDHATLFAISPQADASAYSAPAIVVLLGLFAAGAAWLVRRHRAPGGAREVPAWDGGFAAPPPWLPFGDPATQYTGASFSEPLRRTLGAALLGAREVVERPLPGEIRAARLSVVEADPVERFLFHPIGVVCARVSDAADRMRVLTVRGAVALMFAALVLLLAIVAWLEAA